MNYIYRIFTLFLVMSSCSNLFAQETKDTLYIYVERIKPYAFTSDKGEQVGVFVDFIDSLFEDVHSPYKIVMRDSLPLDSIRHYSCCITSQNLWRKLPEDTASYERMIFHSTGALLHAQEREISSFSDVENYRVCVRDTSFLLHSASQYGLDLSINQVYQKKSVEQAIPELTRGKHDFIVDDYLLLYWYLEKYDIQDVYLMEYKSLSNIYKLHMSAANSPDLVADIDRAFLAKSKNKVFHKVFKNWFGYPHQVRLQQIEGRLYLYLVCLIVLIVFLIMGILIYKKKSKGQTRVFEELSDILMGFPHAIDIYVDGNKVPSYSNNKSLELAEELRKHPGKVHVQDEEINFVYRKHEVCIKVYIDVTELENARLAAERTSRLKTQFLANTSHDLRSPLNSIVGFAALLSECEDEAEIEEYAKIIETNTNDLLRLIDGIIELSLLETSGELQFKRKPTELYKQLQRIHQEYELHLQRIGKPKVELNLVTNFDNMLILTDETYLHRALRNVLTNACKYTYKGSIEIQATFHVKSEELIFKITDTGVGMSKEKVATLFSKKDHRDPNQKGSFGFGLMICKAIVEQMDGTMTVESAEGVGTTIKVITKPEVLNWSQRI